MVQLKVLKYDEDKAKRIVILLKYLELFGLFLFTFGLNRFGYLIYNNYPKIFSELFAFETINCFTLWLTGFLMLVLIGIALIIIWGVILLICSWLKANWRWAQVISEDKGVKAERLSEQKKLKEIRRIEKQEKQREKYGYCVGDTAVMVKDGNYERAGTKFEITRIGEDGRYISCKVNGVKYSDCPKKKFTFVKNKLPKKPKLNTLRQKEVDSWKKVK